MYNLQINELTPGRKYYVKVRAKAPDLEVSDWSPIFEFTTSQDTVPPHRVGNLTFVSQGDSFIGQWNAPTINADGTPCTDLSHYVLRLTNIDTEVTVTIRSSINSFTLDFNNNRQLFGTPAGRIKIEVAAVDIVGNTGAYEEAIAQNPAPAKVQNVSATAGVEAINLYWDAGSDTDISHYEIHVSTTGSGFAPGTTTYRGQVSAGTTTYAYGTSSISTVFLKVIAVDKFNQKSVPSDAASAQPKLSTDYDKTPPGVVGGFTVTQVLSPDNNSAIARISYTPVMQDDLDKYEVQYRKTGETALPWSFANVPSDQSTAEIKPLPLATSYDFRIRAVDFNANKGDWSSVVVAAGVQKTTLPAAPTGVTVTGGLTNLMITWSASNDPSMANWGGTYEVQISKDTSFTSPITIKTASTLASFINLDPNTIYYVRIRSIDPFLNVGPWTVSANGNTGIVTDLSAAKIFSTATAPANNAANALRTNDLWIRDSDKRMHRWNGTTWEDAQDMATAAAMQSANARNRNIYSTSVASGTSINGYAFVNGDTWFRKDANDTVIAMWEFLDGIWVAKTLNNQVIANLDAGKINTGFLNAARIQAGTIDSTKVVVEGLDGSVVIQNGTIVAEKLAANSVTTEKLAADSVTANKILAGQITGEKLAANTAIINNLQIQSALTINAAGGHIKSSNWNDSAKTGFYMDQQQLIVHNGRIEAAAIKLQDSSNIMQPTYASFNARDTAYAVANMWTSSVSGITKFPADGKFGGDSLQAVITANTGFIGMGHSATDLNIPIEGGKQYIISFYVSNRSSKVITLQPELYQTASILIKATATSIANSTAWTRYSMVVTAPATMTRAILRFNLTVGATATFRLDGIQVEQKIGQETAPSNWSPPGYTSIDGESITTGAISSNQTINTGNGAIARWSINTNGNARFADATIDGKLIVGGYGTDQTKNANVAIQSDQYSAGVSGWAIKGNGDAEFNNGTFRGTLNLTKADLTMTAAVSPIKVYTTPTVSSTVDVANIQGVTYAYSRIEEGDYYKPDPTQIRADKKARFFVGPTTDRAVNIQVHDKDEVGAVFLEVPPDNVILTSLNIGEQTDSSSMPLNIEDQGVVYSAKRIENKNYTYAGASAEGKKTVVESTAGSRVKLRSPHYPEKMGDVDVYPRSNHIINSEIDYVIPKNKNLLPGEVASGWQFPWSIHTLSGAVQVSPALKTISGSLSGRFGMIQAEPFQASRHFMIAPFPTLNVAANKRHIVSFYVDSQEATSDYYVGLSKGATQFDSTEPAAGTLPTKPNFYNATIPADYFKLSTDFNNTGNNKGVGNFGDITGSPSISGGQLVIPAGARVRATGAKTNTFVNGGTVSMWFNPSASNTGICTFYHRGNPSSIEKEMWITFDANREALNGGLSFSGTTREWTSNTILEREKWHHIAIVVGPSATNRVVQVYINGVRELDTTFTSLTGFYDTNQFLYLGSDRNLTQDFVGSMGDVAHWETALTATQVAEVHATNRSAYPFFAPPINKMTKVEAGQSARRVSFYSDNVGAGDIQVLFATSAPSRLNLYGFQIEEAAYKDDTSLPLDVRNSGQPTAWSVSNLEVSARAVIEAEAHPIANFLDYIDSTKFLLPDQRADDPVAAPAEIKFNLSSSFSDDFAVDSIFSSDLFQSEAEYRMTPRGMVYPGSNVPFLPTAMTLRYDFSELGETSKPRIGGSGYMSLLLNSPAHGNVRVGGAGVVLTEGFNGGSGSLPSPWQAVNLTVTVGSDRAKLASSTSTKSEGEGYAYHGRQLGSADHDVSVVVRDTTTAITYAGIAGPVISIDPVKGDRISLVLTNGTSSQSWKLIAHKSNVKTILLTGTRSADRSSSPRVRLVREGNKLTGYYNNETLFTPQTFSSSQLPQNGKYTGFTGGRGGVDNFRASLAGDGAFTRGIVQPYSININNGRGLQVFGQQENISGRIYQPGEIYVLAPGYYNFSVHSVPVGRWGTADTDWYRYSLELTDKNGNVRIVRINNAHDMYSPNLGNFAASMPAYAEGKVSFIIETNDTSATYINTIEINIVRLA